MDDSQAAWQLEYAVKDALPLGFCSQPPLEVAAGRVAELVEEAELEGVSEWGIAFGLLVGVVTGSGVPELEVVPGRVAAG